MISKKTTDPIFFVGGGRLIPNQQRTPNRLPPASFVAEILLISYD